MAYRGEHEVREEEARLRARWRWLRRTGAAETANYGDGAWRRRALRLLLALADERAKWGSGEERGTVGQVKASAWSGRAHRGATRTPSPAFGGHAAAVA